MSAGDLTLSELLRFNSAATFDRFGRQVTVAVNRITREIGEDHVAEMQKFWRGVGLDVKVDGKYGSITAGLTQTFQEALILGPYLVSPLKPDAKPGPMTSAGLALSIEHGYNVSPHFAWHEWITKNPDKLVTSRNRGILLYRPTIILAEAVRGDIGPFSPLSGYRDPYWNWKVGGKPASTHLTGRAFDIDVYRYAITEVRARQLGARGVGVVAATGRCAHLDMRDRPDFWTY